MIRNRGNRSCRIPIKTHPFTPATYPGRRPRFSFFFTPKGIYRVKLRTVNRFLIERKLPPLTERYAILAYGSNACPDRLRGKKLSDVLVLYGRLVGAEAVYAGRTAGNGAYIPATLSRKKGSRSSWITLLTDKQFAAMDESEGRPDYYELTELTKAKFFVGKRQVTPLYAYVNILNGVMTLNGRPVSLRSMRQKRAKLLVRPGATVEKAASACLDYIVIPYPDAPPRYSKIIRR